MRATIRTAGLITAAILCAAVVPSAHAQFKDAQVEDHVSVGIFGNGFRWQDTKTNLAGVGARVGFNLTPRLQLEAEMSYNFEQVFYSSFKNGSGVISTQRSNVRTIDGLFGPKLMTNRGPVRLFLTAKGGFVNFSFSNGPATAGSFTGIVGALNSRNMNGVVYPGGGAEAFLGPIGLRFDVGDEIFFNGGPHNNLRVSFGPTIRF